MKKNILSLLTIAVFLITACKPTTSNNSSTEAPKEDITDEMNIISEYIQGDSFEINLPKGMSSTEILVEDADMQYMNMFKELYLTGLTETKEEVYELYPLLLEALEAEGESISEDTLVNYFNVVDLNFQAEGLQPINNIKEIPMEEGVRCMVRSYKAKVDGLDIVYIVGSYMTPNNFHNLTFWTDDAKRDDIMPKYKAAIQSFKLKN